MLASHKGRRGKTLSDVTVPEDQTPFSYDVDYVLGDTMFSYSLEATLEHETGLQPRLRLYRTTADGAQPSSCFPMSSYLEFKKRFGLITTSGQ